MISAGTVGDTLMGSNDLQDDFLKIVMMMLLFRKEMNLQQSLSSLKEELAKADQTLREILALHKS